MIDFEKDYVATDEVKDKIISELGRNTLITGPSGVGKTTLALIRANMIVNGEAVDKADSRDIQMIHSSRLAGGAAAIQEILSDVAHRFKTNVIIIDEFHTLSLAATEAFLPILEDNLPEHTHWIFTTTNPEKVPAAVKSRLKQIVLKAPEFDTIKGYEKFKGLTRAQYVKHQGNLRAIINNELSSGEEFEIIDWSDYVGTMLVAVDGTRDLYKEAIDQLTVALREHSGVDPNRAFATAKRISTLTAAAIKTNDTVMRNIATVEIMSQK